MGPVFHLGITSVFLAAFSLSGTPEMGTVAACLTGGILIDADKVFEIYHNKIKKYPPDITARCRILHSILAFPFGFFLNYLADSHLPLFAVLLHVIADSSIPGLTQDGRCYCTHPPLKWIMLPFPAKWWHQVVPKGWPVKYPPQLNLYYKLAEPIGFILTIFSALILWKN